MHQSHSLTPYDILHNIDFSTNLSLIFTYLNYFPPPPPVIPGPPPRHSWICSARSLSLPSCFIVDDPNHSSSHTYIPSITTNRSSPIKNTNENNHKNFKSLSIIDFFQHQLILIFFLSIFISFVLVILIFFCIQRNRQRQSTSNTHREVNNNNNHKYFYHRLIPDRTRNRRRKKMPTTIATTTTEALRNMNDGNNLLNLTNHDSSSFEAIHLSKINVKYTNANEEEQEEAI